MYLVELILLLEVVSDEVDADDCLHNDRRQSTLLGRRRGRSPACFRFTAEGVVRLCRPVGPGSGRPRDRQVAGRGSGGDGGVGLVANHRRRRTLLDVRVTCLRTLARPYHHLNRTTNDNKSLKHVLGLLD